MPADLRAVVDDLAAEEDDLRALLERLTDDQWSAPTPAAGWTVLDQVAHLAEGEELAALALRDESAFAARLGELVADLDAALAEMEARGRGARPADVLARWDAARVDTFAGLRALAPGRRVQWVSGLMSSVSFATARLMETWAHGQDVADAVGVERPATDRLRHVAHLGVATRGFSFANRGLEVPAEPRVVLGAPGGGEWAWGPDGAAEEVRGPALDFCLVVTQRRHVDDTALVATGDGAQRWLAIAQAFAGPPTDGPPPSR